MKPSKPTAVFTESKNWKRLQPVLFTGLNAAVTPIVGMLVSLLVVRYFGALIWGDFVQEYLWMNIGAHVMAFGSKEMLLRNFALQPADANDSWQSSIKSRTPLLLLLILILFILPIGIAHILWITAWLFFRFVYQNFESVVVFRRKFQFSIICELLGGLVICIVLYFLEKDLSTLRLLEIFAVAECVKAICMILLQYNTFPIQLAFGFDFTQLKKAFPFFLIGFAGLLHSRIDQLLATQYLGSAQLAFYQIMMSILLTGQSVAYFIVQPYLKNLYRMSDETISKIALRLTIAGSVVSPLIIIAGAALIHYCYKLQGDFTMMISAFFFLVPFYYAVPFIYALYKVNEEKKVLYANLAIILLNLIFLPYLFSNFSLSAVLLFNAVIQIIQAIAFKVMTKKAL